jgi:hypothetical protein
MSTWHARSKLLALAACDVGQAAVNLFDQVLDRDVACKLAAILVMVLFDAKMGAEAIKHLNDLSRLPFRQQIDLQIEMIPSVSDDAHPVLLHQYESRDQNRLERGDRR